MEVAAAVQRSGVVGFGRSALRGGSIAFGLG